MPWRRLRIQTSTLASWLKEWHAFGCARNVYAFGCVCNLTSVPKKMQGNSMSLSIIWKSEVRDGGGRSYLPPYVQGHMYGMGCFPISPKWGGLRICNKAHAWVGKLCCVSSSSLFADLLFIQSYCHASSPLLCACILLSLCIFIDFVLGCIESCRRERYSFLALQMSSHHVCICVHFSVALVMPNKILFSRAGPAIMPQG